jgi:ankyrin repeat protein
MLAAGNSTPEVITALMARQTFRIDEANPSGATALGYAVAAGRIDNVRLLLKLGADPKHLSGKDKLTDIARWQGREDIARLLHEASQ